MSEKAKAAWGSERHPGSSSKWVVTHPELGPLRGSSGRVRLFGMVAAANTAMRLNREARRSAS